MDKKGLPDTVREMFEHVGGLGAAETLTPKEEEFVWNTAFNGQPLLIGFDEENREMLYCPRCRESFNAGHRTKHKEKMECPACGIKSEVFHTWRAKYKRQKSVVYLYRKSVKQDNAIVALCLYIEVYWQWPGCEMEAPWHVGLEVQLDSMSVYVAGAGGKMISPKGGGRIDNAYRWQDWKTMEELYVLRATSPQRRDGLYINGGFGRSTDLDSVVWDEESLFTAAEGTPFEYGLGEYMPYEDDFCIRWLDKSQRNRSYEMLLKIGLGDMVGKVIGGYWMPNGARINWRGKKLTTILGKPLTKADKKLLHEDSASAKEFGSQAMRLWQKSELSVKEAVDYSKDFDCRTLTALSEDEGIDIRKLAKYLYSLGDATRHSAYDYRDYIKELKELGWKMDRKTLFPKNLRAAHEKTMKLIKVKKNQEVLKRYTKRLKLLKDRFSYTEKKYAIVIPDNVFDLIDEGKAMHNCVGGYVDRVSHGETNVVFLRKKKRIKKSFVTVEIANDGHIVQARSFANGSLDTEVQEFMDRYAAEIIRRMNEPKRKRRKSA